MKANAEISRPFRRLLLTIIIISMVSATPMSSIIGTANASERLHKVEEQVREMEKRLTLQYELHLDLLTKMNALQSQYEKSKADQNISPAWLSLIVSTFALIWPIYSFFGNQVKEAERRQLDVYNERKAAAYEMLSAWNGQSKLASEVAHILEMWQMLDETPSTNSYRYEVVRLGNWMHQFVIRYNNGDFDRKLTAQLGLDAAVKEFWRQLETAYQKSSETDAFDDAEKFLKELYQSWGAILAFVIARESEEIT